MPLGNWYFVFRTNWKSRSRRDDRLKTSTYSPIQSKLLIGVATSWHGRSHSVIFVNEIRNCRSDQLFPERNRSEKATPALLHRQGSIPTSEHNLRCRCDTLREYSPLTR